MGYHFAMGTVLIVILLLAGVFVVASLVLGRTTGKVDSARSSEYLDLEGNWVRYRVSGGGSPVVLVHGWLSSEKIWEDLADSLAQRFTVYTLDLPGFGDSDKPISGYGIRYGSRLLYAFCAHFGLTRAAIVGHDIGGAMAVKLAADHPDVVGRLVLVATPADKDQIDLPTLLWLTTLPVIGPVFYTLGRFLRPLRSSWMRPFVLDPDDLVEKVIDDAGRSTPAAIAKTLGAVRRETARGKLIRQARIIKVPTLVFSGEEDQIIDPQATGQWAQALPAEVVLLNECGHLPMIEHTNEFNARVLAFLTGDSSYLDAGLAPGESLPSGRAPEEPHPPTRIEPENRRPEDVTESGSPPKITRKQNGLYPSRDQEPEDDRAEDHPRNRARNRGDTGVPEIPELPEGLFEWPDRLKKSQPWKPSQETDPEAKEESDEDKESEDPKEEPRA